MIDQAASSHAVAGTVSQREAGNPQLVNDYLSNEFSRPAYMLNCRNCSTACEVLSKTSDYCMLSNSSTMLNSCVMARPTCTTSDGCPGMTSCSW